MKFFAKCDNFSVIFTRATTAPKFATYNSFVQFKFSRNCIFLYCLWSSASSVKSTSKSFICFKVPFLSIQGILLQKPNYAFLWVTTDIMSRVLKIVTRRCTFKMPKKQQGKFPKCFSLTSASSQNISCFQLLTVDKSDFYRLKSAKLNLVKKRKTISLS